MIKSIVSSIVAISVLATPVVAEAKGRGEHRSERHERKRGNHPPRHCEPFDRLRTG